MNHQNLGLAMMGQNAHLVNNGRSQTVAPIVTPMMSPNMNLSLNLAMLKTNYNPNYVQNYVAQTNGTPTAIAPLTPLTPYTYSSYANLQSHSTPTAVPQQMYPQYQLRVAQPQPQAQPRPQPTPQVQSYQTVQTPNNWYSAYPSHTANGVNGTVVANGYNDMTYSGHNGNPNQVPVQSNQNKPQYDSESYFTFNRRDIPPSNNKLWRRRSSNRVLPRQWVVRDSASKPDCCQCVVVSFDIMSSKTAHNRRNVAYGNLKGYHTRTNTSATWETRRDALVNEVLRIDPDVICLQGCDLGQYNFFAQEWFPVGYIGIYEANNYVAIKQFVMNEDGLAIFYRASDYKLVGRRSTILGDVRYDSEIALCARLRRIFPLSMNNNNGNNKMNRNGKADMNTDKDKRTGKVGSNMEFDCWNARLYRGGSTHAEHERLKQSNVLMREIAYVSSLEDLSDKTIGPSAKVKESQNLVRKARNEKKFENKEKKLARFQFQRAIMGKMNVDFPKSRNNASYFDDDQKNDDQKIDVNDTLNDYDQELAMQKEKFETKMRQKLKEKRNEQNNANSNNSDGIQNNKAQHNNGVPFGLKTGLYRPLVLCMDLSGNAHYDILYNYNPLCYTWLTQNSRTTLHNDEYIEAIEKLRELKFNIECDSKWILQSVYALASPIGKEPDYTMYERLWPAGYNGNILSRTVVDQRCTDFIMCSPNNVRVLETLDKPKLDFIEQAVSRTMPNAMYPSNHLLIAARLEILYQKYKPVKITMKKETATPSEQKNIAPPIPPLFSYDAK